MIIAFDTETNGVDFWHGCRPFFVSTCDETGLQRFWEWDVDPTTREVAVPPEDLNEIHALLDGADRIIGQNIRFDVHAMATLDPRFLKWWWDKTDDTMIRAHAIESGQLKDLGALCINYLDYDIAGSEKALGDAVQKARRIVQSKGFVEEWGEWSLGRVDHPMNPSVKGSSGWRTDYWLPRTLYDRFDWVREEHPGWGRVLRDYANLDTEVLIPLDNAMDYVLQREGLVSQYRSRMETLPVVWGIEEHGVTTIPGNLKRIRTSYEGRVRSSRQKCIDVAKSLKYDLELPKGGGVNKSLTTFFFDVLKVPKVYNRKSKTGAPTLDNKLAMGHYLDVLPHDEPPRAFVEALVDARKASKSLEYLDAYDRFAVRESDRSWRLHPSVNPAGTGVTRRSSSNPNSQQISKQKDGEGLNVRYGFGPGPGREWWSMDYENIELRIPAYASEEESLIALYERSEDPPYYGSEHILNFETVYPEIWEKVLSEVGPEKVAEVIKKRYKDTNYAWVKAGDFSIQYGSTDRADGTGTADRAFRRPGSHAKLRERFARKEKLTQEMVAYATHHGYVHTMADRTVDPEKGYRVSVPREGGRVKPTQPFSFFVQGTAGQCMSKALVRCDRQLNDWGPDYWIAMEVHDELVFDFPKGGRRNLPKVRKLRMLMEESGTDIGVPLKVSVSYHPKNWAEEERVEGI